MQEELMESVIKETERKFELKKYRDQVAEYLSPNYNYDISDDPVVTGENGSYGASGRSMARTTNILEAAQILEYITHPKINLVSPENSKQLRIIVGVLKEITTPKREKDEVSGETLVNPETGDRLDRTYRTREDMVVVKANIKNAVNILDQELQY